MQSQWEEPPVDRSGLHFAMPTLTPVVKWLLIANVGIFLIHHGLFYQTFDSLFRFVHDAFALVPELWKSWFPFVPVWQLVTYSFLHGGIGHILYNLIFLYFLGTLLEGIVGPRRFLAFYLIAAALAGLAQLVLGLALGQSAPIVGASGGVLAVACAVATFQPRMRVIFLIVPMTLKTLVLIYVGIDAFQALMELKGAGGNVAHFAHLTGAAVGYLSVKSGWIWRDPLRQVEGWRKRVEQDRRVASEERLDRLLEKINREGIHALSASERAFLKRASKRR